MSFKEASEGWYKEVPPHMQDMIRTFTEGYKVRCKGKGNDDGSYGRVRLTPLELDDMLAGAILASLSLQQKVETAQVEEKKFIVNE
jgi:hypothetical protein